MAAVDIAFVTSGDSRSPDAQPLSGRTSRGANQGQIPYSTISDMYEAYARRLVREGSNVFRVPNSREAQRQIVR